MKEFLFSKEGNVPRDLVNIKPKGQAQEDQTAWEEGGRDRHAYTHAQVCCVFSWMGGIWGFLKCCEVSEIDKSREFLGGRRGDVHCYLERLLRTGWLSTILLLVS